MNWTSISAASLLLLLFSFGCGNRGFPIGPVLIQLLPPEDFRDTRNNNQQTDEDYLLPQPKAATELVELVVQLVELQIKVGIRRCRMSQVASRFQIDSPGVLQGVTFGLVCGRGRMSGVAGQVAFFRWRVPRAAVFSEDDLRFEAALRPLGSLLSVQELELSVRDATEGVINGRWFGSVAVADQVDQGVVVEPARG